MPPKRPPNDAKPTGKKGKEPKFPQSEGSTSAPKPDLLASYREYDEWRTKHYKTAIKKYARDVMGMGQVNLKLLTEAVFGTGSQKFYFHDSVPSETDVALGIDDTGFVEQNPEDTCISKLERHFRETTTKYTVDQLTQLCRIINDYMFFKRHISPLAIATDNRYKQAYETPKNPWETKGMIKSSLNGIFADIETDIRRERGQMALVEGRDPKESDDEFE